jgi:hypothetical protein
MSPQFSRPSTERAVTAVEELASASSITSERPSYGGLPFLKPPVWGWEVALYFFVGGLAGMAAVIAAALFVRGGEERAVIDALITCVIGAAISAVLLIVDLGRPKRFLYMLRVFKWRSPMSVGVWLLTAFGGGATAALVLAILHFVSLRDGVESSLARLFTAIFLMPTAVLGSLVATYTGVLIGASVIPAWHSHRRSLPVHFGVSGLGSAAAVLELLGHAPRALIAIGLAAALVETGVGVVQEVHRHGAIDKPLRAGKSGLLLRASLLLEGPLSLTLRLAGLHPLAAIAFLAGALGSRFGWISAGKASAREPRGVLDEQSESAESARPSPA